MDESNHIPDFDEMFPGYYNAGHLEDGEQTVRIRTIIKDELPVIGNNGKPTGKTQDKWVLLFSDTPNRMVLNETNASLIKALFGRKTSAWIGKRITLHAEPNCGFGRPGVRVCGSPDIDADVSARPGLMPKPNRVYTLRKTSAPEPVDEDLAAFTQAAQREHGLSLEQIDAWLSEHGKPGPVAKLTTRQRAALFDALGKVTAWLADQTPEQPSDDGGDLV